MTLAELRYRVRQRCGSPTVNEVPSSDLDLSIQNAVALLAAELHYDIQTDENITLVEDQREYPLPDSLSLIMWVQLGGTTLLEPTSTYQYNARGTSSGSGTAAVNWHTLDSGTPTMYAVERRRLILLPPADATAVSASGYLAMRWIGSGANGLTASGTPGLGELDQKIVELEGAIDWLTSRPTEENAARVASYTAQSARLMKAAKRRSENPIEEFSPGFRVSVDRWSGAR